MNVQINTKSVKALRKKLEQASENIDRNVERSASQVSIAMVGYAKQNAHVRTGNMRNSIVTISPQGFVMEGESIVMGARATANYSIFEEYGTGPKGDPAVPHTSKSRWWYWDKTAVNQDGTVGRLRMGVSREAHPFLRPALKEHIEEYKTIIAGNVGRVFQ